MMPHRARPFAGWVRGIISIAALFVSSFVSGVTPAEAQALPNLRTTFVPRLLPEPNECYMFSCFDRASYDGTTLAAIGTIEPIVHVYRRIPAGPWGAQGAFRNKTTLPPGYDRAGYRYPLAVVGDDVVVTAFRSGPVVPELCETRVFGRTDTLWAVKQTINVCAEQFAKDGSRFLLSAGNSLIIYARGANGMFAEEGRIVAPSAGFFDGEKSLALHGWTVVVGKPDRDADTGAAYIFQRRDGVWALAKTLLSEGAGAARLGHAVGVYEYNVAVSAPGAIPPSGNGTGLIYIYTGVNDDWSLSQQIAEGVTTGNPVGNAFGMALTLRGRRLLISTTSPFDSGLGPPTYLFERGMRESDWVARATLAGNGLSIDLSGNTAMVDRRGPRGGTFPTVVNLPALREPEVAP